MGFVGCYWVLVRFGFQGVIGLVGVFILLVDFIFVVFGGFIQIFIFLGFVRIRFQFDFSCFVFVSGRSLVCFGQQFLGLSVSGLVDSFLCGMEGLLSGFLGYLRLQFQVFRLLVLECFFSRVQGFWIGGQGLFLSLVGCVLLWVVSIGVICFEWYNREGSLFGVAYGIFSSFLRFWYLGSSFGSLL